ncbi:MAG TPA: RNA polymerase sigma factor [Candidatus Aquilonibacter sp.]|nr:RNA polymerase sigma factor [Candidatus Aquilonibacter sp.]
MAILVPLDLVERARTGQPDDIEDLLRAIWPDAYRLARAILGDDQSAADAAQEACIILYRTIASLRDANAFRAWFYRIVVREASDLKRRRSRTEPALQSASHDVDYNTSIDVWRALASLPLHLREVVVLRYFEDLSSREIAAALRIPDGTVRFRLMIARQRLRPLLGVDSDHFAPTTDGGQLHAI